jgi:hypothetical protein
VGVDIVSCGTGKWDRRIANPGPYRAYLGYGLPVIAERGLYKGTLQRKIPIGGVATGLCRIPTLQRRISIQIPDDCGNLWFENRELNGDQIPHNLPVDIKIPVDNPIACLGHPFPFYGGVLFSYRGGDIFRRLTDHFNRTSYGMRKIVVMDQIVQGPAFYNSLEKHHLVFNVDEENPVRFQSRSHPG